MKGVQAIEIAFLPLIFEVVVQKVAINEHQPGEIHKGHLATLCHHQIVHGDFGHEKDPIWIFVEEGVDHGEKLGRWK